MQESSGDEGNGSDSVTEVTSTSWGGRIIEALKGLVIGPILIILAVVLLSWNEGRAVDRAKALASGAEAVVSVAADRVDPANAGRLVHLSGLASTRDTLRDSVFGVARPGVLRLERLVEMYQWHEETTSETHEKPGGHSETITTYRYAKGWHEGLISSASFHAPSGHANPPDMPVSSQTWQAQTVTVGAFRLSASLRSALTMVHPLPPSEIGRALPERLAGLPLSVRGDWLYLGKNPESPQIGDMRIRFSEAEPAVITLISQQYGDSFVPFATPTGEVELVQYGQVEAASLFRTANDDNALLTWGLRLVGLLVMLFGFRAGMDILEVLASVIPPLGTLVDVGVTLLALVMALTGSVLTIAIAWLAYRPLIGGALIVLAILIAGGSWLLRQRRQALL